MATIPAFSVVLWQLVPGYDTLAPQISPPVPAGRVWVVREVVAVNRPGGAIFGHGIQALTLFIDAQPIWNTPWNQTMTGPVYELRDVRYVLDSPSALECHTLDGNWSLRVTGYDLSA